MSIAGVDFAKVKNMARKGLDKARQYAEGLNELEVKVEEATNSDKWGPHGTLMQEITRRSFNMEDYKQILGILARRLHSEPNMWRQIYKSLLLLEYMAKNGPERMVAELKSNSKVFTKLQRFQYVDSQNKDQGVNVRNRAKELWTLVNDSDMIAAERTKAAKNRTKYTGMDSQGFTTHAPPAVYNPSPQAGSVASSAPSAAADSGADEDPVAATQQRLDALGVSSEEGGGADTSAAARAVSSPLAKHKPKLSSIRVDSSIQATFRNFPVSAPHATEPQRTSSAAAADGLNLLDFGDDEEDAIPVPSTSAPPDDVGDDWAEFSVPAASTSVAAELDPFSDPFGAAPEVGGSSTDPFASSDPPTGEARPLSVASNGAKAGRPPLPMDAFADFSAVPIPAPAQVAIQPQGLPGVGTLEGGAFGGADDDDDFQPFQSGGVNNGQAPAVAPPALKGGALHDKPDPFADLLGM